jgi:hypothetical protein
LIAKIVTQQRAKIIPIYNQIKDTVIPIPRLWFAIASLVVKNSVEGLLFNFSVRKAEKSDSISSGEVR